MVRTDHLTMGVFTDPAHLLVEATEESDVDTVLVDGRILMRDGKLTSINPEQVMTDAAASLESVARRIH
jgi:5-methylthioadenosine/S-adenosylhomocysteine deaminase